MSSLNIERLNEMRALVLKIEEVKDDGFYAKKYASDVKELLQFCVFLSREVRTLMTDKQTIKDGMEEFAALLRLPPEGIP